MIKVSVLTPAYNADKYIKEAIESILAQTYKNFEFIIANDYSTDNTKNIIESYRKIDNRIKLLDNSENLGIAGNRNELIKLAKGKYIVWQDADDISISTRLEKLVRKMESDHSIGICGSYIEMFEDSKKLGIRKYHQNDFDLRKNIFKYSPVAQPSAIIKKECFDKVGLYNLEMPPAEDIEMSFRIGTLYKFANVPEVLLRYRVHGKSATSTKLETIEKNTLKARKTFAKNSSYKMSAVDKIYNWFQEVTINILPAKSRMGLFNFVRNNFLK